MLKIYQNRKSSGVRVHTRSVHAPIADTHPIATKSSAANCTIWETYLLTAPLIYWSPTHNTVAPSATNTSMLTSATWQTPVVIILAKLSIWRCDWLWKTACHIDRHPGIYGETIGFSSPGLQSRTGLRQREKKAEQRITTDYLDGALADFSGYIAADE